MVESKKRELIKVDKYFAKKGACMAFFPYEEEEPLKLFDRPDLLVIIQLSFVFFICLSKELAYVLLHIKNGLFRINPLAGRLPKAPIKDPIKLIELSTIIMQQTSQPLNIAFFKKHGYM